MNVAAPPADKGNKLKEANKEGSEVGRTWVGQGYNERKKVVETESSVRQLFLSTVLWLMDFRSVFVKETQQTFFTALPGRLSPFCLLLDQQDHAANQSLLLNGPAAEAT